ncbi:ParB/RepB/Spo0J family partition protein [Legionella clemsonensis]|uniref:Probable chromosome-partitioning protein ParB n=1 Tax=Legionella clemsonensis TaxID=1867846 RepID=A0A222P6B1_9GAMM|nr:ParB/RepB/Spo0J family partition protein [Legionella clemsonensis]ASQ47386.1 putative chromosome-partitioning protein ParB [Legionella clemsonensis]
MTVKTRGLGRNLSALLGTAGATLTAEKPAPSESAVLKLAINSLKPGKYQPRGEIEETALAELAASIKQQGILQPLVVREIADDQYEIIAGERRWRASQLAGLTEVPVILRQVDDETAMAIALVENLQREDLNAMDQARAMYRLTTEFGLTHQQIAELLSKSRAAVSNFLRLLQLTPEVKRFLENGDMDMGHARALLMLDDKQQIQVAQLIVAKSLSVRETEKLVARVKTGKTETTAKHEINACLQEQVDTLAQRLNAAIKIKHGKAGKGTLVIHYDNLQNLQAVIEELIGD